MKKMTIYGFLFSIMLGLCLSGFAQNKAEEMAGKMTDWMKTNLKLNDNQITQVQAINLKYANKMQDLNANTAQTKEQKMDVMKENSKAKDDELKAILTPDQFKTYEAKKSEMKEKMKAEKAAAKQ